MNFLATPHINSILGPEDGDYFLSDVYDFVYCSGSVISGVAMDRRSDTSQESTSPQDNFLSLRSVRSTKTAAATVHFPRIAPKEPIRVTDRQINDNQSNNFAVRIKHRERQWNIGIFDSIEDSQQSELSHDEKINISDSTIFAESQSRSSKNSTNFRKSEIKRANSEDSCMFELEL